MNSTMCGPSVDASCFPPSSFPPYYSPKESLIDGVSDHTFCLIVPIATYWIFSLFFHVLDSSNWKWLEKYRLHPTETVDKRNLVTRTEVVLHVAIQQFVQTALGYYVLSEDETQVVDHAAKLVQLSGTVQRVLGSVWGAPVTAETLARLTSAVYWWVIPSLQFLAGMFILDTWQYFWHRGMHVNKWLYRNIHSWHHRLYVPYSYGALYNHPVEGFIFDSAGALVAQAIAGMTTRQAMVLFGFACFKTVDDHCGYNFPLDPFQIFMPNNADYHDIHHQPFGIKFNFAQPFFVHWDILLGTRLTREEVVRRKLGKSKKEE